MPKPHPSIAAENITVTDDAAKIEAKLRTVVCRTCNQHLGFDSDEARWTVTHQSDGTHRLAPK